MYIVHISRYNFLLTTTAHKSYISLIQKGLLWCAGNTRGG